MNNETYIVVCLDEGEMVLATRQIFPTREGAENDARICAKSRRAKVVAGRWTQLRAPADHMYIPKVYERYDDRCAKCELKMEAHTY